MQEVRTHYGDGSTNERFFVDEAWRKQGLYEQYHANGNLYIKCTYKDGQLDGSYERYFDDGELDEKRVYINGELKETQDSTDTDAVKNNMGTFDEWVSQTTESEVDAIFESAKQKLENEKQEKREYRYRYWDSSNKVPALSNNLQRLYLEDTTEDYWGNWSIAGSVQEYHYQKISKMNDLEFLSLDNVRFPMSGIMRLSGLKNLRELVIHTGNSRMNSYEVPDFHLEHLRALGRLPKLEKLTLNLRYMNDDLVSYAKDLERIKKQFPNIKQVILKDERILDWNKLPDVISSITDKDDLESLKDLIKQKFSARRAEIEEEKRIKSLTGPDWKNKFAEQVKAGKNKEALEILELNGVLSSRKKEEESSFGREQNCMRWGNNSMSIKDDLVGIDIKQIDDNVFAVGQIYENRSWRSTVGYSSGIGWYWQGEVAMVHLENGVGEVAQTNSICVRDPDDGSQDIFQNISKKDFVSVNGDTVSVHLGGYTSASVSIPKEEPVVETPAVTEDKHGDLRARLKALQEANQAAQATIQQNESEIKALEAKLTKDTPERNKIAEAYKTVRRYRDSKLKG